MRSCLFQVIVTGAKIGFTLKPLRSVRRKRSKENIARVRGLCIGFDIGGQARITSIRAWDAISAPSAFISALSGKYQVLLRTDCTTLERQEGTPKLLSITIVSAPHCTDCNRILRLPGFRNCRYDPAYPVAVKYHSDSIWTSGDFRLDIAAASAMLLPCSIPSRKRSGKHTNSEHDWAWILHELAHGKDAAKLTRTIASRRSDNPVLFIYAQRTVNVASASFASSKAFRSRTFVTPLVVRRCSEIASARCIRKGPSLRMRWSRLRRSL